LPEPCEVTITIYDMQGKVVRTLVDAYHCADHYQVTWDARTNQKEPVASGIYICRFNADNRIFQKKMLLVR